MLWTAFLFGLFGGLHCISMCGPIVMALPRQTGFRGLASKVIYNLGRVVTYSSLGAITGIIGNSLQQYQQYLSIISGVLLITLVLVTGFKNLEFTYFKPFIAFANQLKKLFSRFLKKKSAIASLLVGIVNGFLPCGLVYMALIASLASGGFFESVLYMAVFGLGTFPVMLGIAFAGHLISVPLRQKLFRIVPVLVFLLGTLFILRGLNLGIPFVSPQLSHSQEKFEMCSP